MNDRFLRRVLAFFLVIFGVLAVIAAGALRYTSISASSADWVNHINATVHEIDGFVAAVQEADGEMRAFALSGDPRERAASREAFDRMTEHFEIGKALTRDDPGNNATMVALEAIGRKRADLAQEIWNAKDQNQPARIQSLLAADAASGELATFKRDAARLREDQFGRLATAEKIAYRNAQTLRMVVWGGLGANFVLLFSVAWLIRDGLNARRKLAEVLEAANARLEVQVKERTAELQAANESLTVQCLEAKWSNLSMEHQLRYANVIVNAVSDMVLVLTKAFHITRVNTAVINTTGLAETDLINKPLDQFLQIGTSPGGTSSFEIFVRSLRDGRDMRRLAGILVDKRQTRIPVWINLQPLRDRDRIVGAVVTVVRAETIQ